MMMKKILYVLLVICSIQAHGQQGFNWADDIGGVAGSAVSSAITADSVGNVYTTGYFSYTVDINPGVMVDNRVANGAEDIFITKVDANGNFLWAKNIGGAGALSQGHSISIDTAGNVYVTGFFGGTADFDPGTGVYNLISNGGREIFILKLTPNGDFVWAKAIGSSNFDEGLGIKLDNNGHVYITGYFDGTVDFNPNAGICNLTGSIDPFILKLDTVGNFIWAKSMTGLIGNDYGSSITIDDAENVYTTGGFNLTVDFDPGPSTYNLISNGDFDIFVSKLDANGNFVWAKSIGGTQYDVGRTLCIDRTGHIYIAGSFRASVDFNTGVGVFYLNTLANNDDDAFISKFDTAGNFIWAQKLGGYGGQYALSITTDMVGNIYTTGFYSYAVDFGSSTAIYSLTAVGLEDIFIFKLDVNGGFVCATAIGSAANDVGYSIYADKKGNVYTTGTFMGVMDFNPDPNTTFNITPQGGTDVFISKLSQTCISNVAIQDYKNENNTIELFPNPVQDIVNIQLPKPIDKFDNTTYIILYDAIGKEILKEPIYHQSFSLDVSTFVKGFYMAAITKENIILYTHKLMIN